MISAREVTVSRFKSPSECSHFQCEKVGYTTFLQDKNQAKRLEAENTSVTYLFRVGSDIIGYVTLAMSSLKRSDLPKSLQDSHRFSKIPCLLLGQMARDKRYRNKGVGKIMVAWVRSRAYELSREVGCRFVILDAELDRKDHYERYLGFKALPQDPGKNNVPMYFDLGMRGPSLKRRSR